MTHRPPTIERLKHKLDTATQLCVAAADRLRESRATAFADGGAGTADPDFAAALRHYRSADRRCEALVLKIAAAAQ